MKCRRTFPEMLLDITGDPIEALQLAIQITRWKMIANLEIWPDSDEPLPAGVRHARDRALVAA